MAFKIPSNLPGRNTPLVIKEREQGPTGSFYVAPFLPLVRFMEKKEEYVVISTGKLVSFLTSTTYPDMMVLVPAGLKKDLENALVAAAGAADTAAARAAIRAATNVVNEYTALDVQNEVTNYEGNLVVAGEKVVESMISVSGTTLVVDVTISEPVGVLEDDALRSPYKKLHSIADATPMNYRYMNWNPQKQVAFTRDAELELPVVKNDSRNTFKMPGLACLAVDPTWTRTDKTALYGAWLSYDNYSDFVIADPTTTNYKDIVGRVYFVLDTQTELPMNMTDYVKTAPDAASVPEQFAVTGNTTGGLDHSIFFTNALGKAYVHAKIL